MEVVTCELMRGLWLTLVISVRGKGGPCSDFLLIPQYGRSGSGLVFSISCTLSSWLVPQHLAAGVPLRRSSCKIAQTQLPSEVFTASAVTVYS